MKRRRVEYAMLVALLLCFCVKSSVAQRRDPLNDKEIDEMRESADQPDQRLELMVKFARDRMSAIDKLQADGKNAKDRPMQVHDLLEDFTSLLDEIEDNVEMYASHKADMRKGLTLLLEANSEWQLKLRRLKEQSPPEELEQFSFVLANAKDAVTDMADDTREELQEQNDLARQKKLTKVYSERTN
jgi:hypothetical protein